MAKKARNKKEFVKPMLAKSAGSVKKFADEYLVSPKLDGVRLIVHYDLEKHALKYFSRSGIEKDLILGPYFDSELEKVFSDLQDVYVDGLYPDGLCVDGELVLINPDGSFAPVGDINSLVNCNNEVGNALDESVDFKYFIFDITDKKLNASERYNIYKSGIVETDKIKPVEQEIIEGGSEANLQLKSNEYRDEGFEGACFRTLDGKYKPNGRGNMMLKLKAEERPEITAFLTKAYFGEGKFTNVYSKYQWSIYDENDNLIEISHGTSGLTHEEIYLIDQHVKAGNPKIYSDIVYDMLSFNKNGSVSLRFPTIKALRFDLTKEDITKVQDLK